MASSQIFIPPPPPRNRVGHPPTPINSSRFRANPNQPSRNSMFSSAMLDQATGKRDPRTAAMAAVINILLVVLIVWLGKPHLAQLVALPVHITPVTLTAPPMLAPPKPVEMSGGGGQPTPRPVNRGDPPKVEVKPVVMAAPTAAPKIALAVQPVLHVQPDLKMVKTGLPMIGMPPGAPAIAVSAGNGVGAGLGAGIRNGMGAGTGGNYGGGVFKIGGGVSKPEVIFAPVPTFTEAARLAKVTGKVLIYLQVNEQGRPMHVRVIRGLGMGLDEKALEAVRQYRFKPAMKDGRPVTVEMNIEVNFQIL